MKVFVNPGVLSLYASDVQGWFFDAAGRNFAVWEDGWWITHGLSGRSVARRWKDGHRDVRVLPLKDARELKARAREAIQATGSRVPKPWVARALAFDERQDQQAYRATYRRVGILPPDQYECAVVQVTEGCGWNRCHFCTFYANQPFKVRSLPEIEAHAEAVKLFLGEGLARRSSIFLGEANALAMATDNLLAVMKSLKRILVPGIPDFRGFFAFIEPAESAVRTASDFERLRKAGLKRLYWGIETGDPSLRRELHKPGSMEEATTSLRRAKQAELLAGLIFLIGAGGRASREAHRRHSLAWLDQAPLTDADIVFLSPLRGREGAGTSPLSRADMDEEIALWRTRIGPRVRVAPYDIREFVY